MTPDGRNDVLNRRQFLVRSAKTGAAITAACAAGFWLHDPDGPPRPAVSQPAIRLPDFSIDGMGSKMSIVHGEDRAAALRQALASIGGIEAFIQKGDRVLLKVNAAFASPAMLSATTHPALVTEMTAQCHHAGAASVNVADNPINDPAACFDLTGIAEAARRAGAGVLLPRIEFFEPLTIPDAKLIRNTPVFTKPLTAATKVIGMAPVKNHHRSGASMTMKNWYGLLGGRRNIFHQDINTIIMELALMIKPTLVVLDGIVSMMTNGPTGGSLSDLKRTNTLIVGTDQVAVDAFGATLLDKTARDLPFITMAEAAGIGTADFRSLNPVISSL